MVKIDERFGAKLLKNAEKGSPRPKKGRMGSADD
jgi:hypothetical protein